MSHSMTDITSPVDSHITTSPPAMTAPAGHNLSPSDPDNPQNWSVWKKIYASAVATAFTFSVAFGLTAYTVGITDVVNQFDVSMTTAILGLSLPLFGACFAPIYTPHLSERFGRAPVYYCSLPPFALFMLGAGYAKSFCTLAVCRFFAGFFGAPNLVLIEGTFADVWAAPTTVTYYSFLTLASFIGTGIAPLIGGYIFVGTLNWRWLQWTICIISLAAYLFGIGMPETYPREIARARARRAGVPHRLAPAESGTTIAAMARITIIEPLKMLVTDPITIMITLYLGFNFGVLFSFFISIPVVLNMTYNFTVDQVGLAFNVAIVGSLLAAGMCIFIDQLIFGKLYKRPQYTDILMKRIEYRLIPAIIGSILLIISFFWVANTAAPTFNSPVPIVATGVYVWGNMSVLVSFISYLFDAYPPRGTLSALTAAACFRLACAGVVPLVIVQMIMGLTGRWAYQTFGIIAIVMAAIPVILFVFGERLRQSSKYGAKGMMVHMQEMQHKDPEGTATGHATMRD